MDPIIVEAAKNGKPTAFAGKLRIHSSYNPENEAEKFLKEHMENLRDGAIVVIIGAGLGYIDQKLQEILPQSTLIALHLDSKLYAKRISRKAASLKVKRWHPADSVDIETFLSRALPETSIAGLCILQWPPSLQIRQQVADNVQMALAKIIRRHTGNISCTAAFGRLWLQNSIRNFITTEFLCCPIRSKDPVVLAASGPSLEEAIPLLRRHRASFRLWALPSSLAAISNANLSPDLVVATDPGMWARIHGRYLPANCPVAMPLSAAPLPDHAGAPMLLDQGTPGETIIRLNEPWPAISLPAMGTVAATAIELWKRITDGPLVLTGLDLCWHDLRAHVRPHSFDGWLATRQNRVRPMQQILWERATASVPKRIGRKRVGSVLQTYADWFDSDLREARISRLTRSETPIKLPGIPLIDPKQLGKWKSIAGNAQYVTTQRSPRNKNVRQEMARALLRNWRDRLELPIDRMDSSTLDLMYFLDPGGTLDIRRQSKAKYQEAVEIHRQRVCVIVRKMERLYG